MLVFFEGCYLPAGRGLVGLVGLVFECSFPADVGVITNHQRQAGIGVLTFVVWCLEGLKFSCRCWCNHQSSKAGGDWCFVFRCADLEFEI
jgi:hypothetical protein